jgi:hypothetical protein
MHVAIGWDDDNEGNDGYSDGVDDPEAVKFTLALLYRHLTRLAHSSLNANKRVTLNFVKTFLQLYPPMICFVFGCVFTRSTKMAFFAIVTHRPFRCHLPRIAAGTI